MSITKEYLEKSLTSANQRRDSFIASANGAIAEANVFKKLLEEFDVAPDAPAPEAPVGDENSATENPVEAE